MSFVMLTQIKRVIDKFGKNGTAPPAPDIPQDIIGRNELTDQYVRRFGLMHQFYLIDFAASYIKKQRENLLGALKAEITDLKPIVGQTVSRTMHNLTLNIQTKNPAHTLNEVLLGDYLRKKGWKQSDIDDCITASKKAAKPAETWSVNANG